MIEKHVRQPIYSALFGMRREGASISSGSMDCGDTDLRLVRQVLQSSVIGRTLRESWGVDRRERESR